MIEAGVRVDATDVNDRTALDILQDQKKSKIISLLSRCCVPFWLAMGSSDNEQSGRAIVSGNFTCNEYDR